MSWFVSWNGYLPSELFILPPKGICRSEKESFVNNPTHFGFGQQDTRTFKIFLNLWPFITVHG